MESSSSRSLFGLCMLVTILCIGLAPSIVVAEESENVDVNATASRVAVVTGGNKGIGFAIAKGLCERFDGIVYLTARSPERGQAAVDELKKIGLRPRFHQLDINDDASVETFKNYLNETYGGLDVLVNNAAIQLNSPVPIPVQASESVRVNYFGLLRVSKALFPLLRPHARVVQISSSAGHLSRVPGDELKARLSSSNLTEEGLNQIMRDYVEAAKTNTHQALGWPDRAYSVSKIGVSALSRIQQREIDADGKEDVAINAVHPGFVDTDMTDHLGHFTPERGSQAPLYLALLPRDTDVKGKYVWHDNTLIDWVDGRLPNKY